MWMKLLECARHLKDGWLQDECRYRHLRFQECTQDKTRIGEETSLSITHQFGRISLLKISNLNFKDSSPPFIGEGPVMSLQRSLQRKLSKVSLQLFHF